MIELKQLTKQYKELTAVDQLSLKVEAGELFGLLGPNGAGKSTTISMISTLVKPTSGGIYYKGDDIVKRPKAIQPHLGIVPQEIALYTALSGLDNLKFWGGAYGLKGEALKKRIDEVSDIIGIGNRLKDRVDKYSGGMQRRINIGAALLHEPDLLIMDEPTVGIDPQSRNHILETVKELNRQGMTIIYTSHYMEEVEALCDRIAIMDHGQVIAQGTQEELLASIASENTIAIAFSAVDEALIADISAHPQVKNVVVDAQTIKFLSGQSQVVKDIFDIASRHAIDIAGVDIEQPNLEAVFLNLTGKALRD